MDEKYFIYEHYQTKMVCKVLDDRYWNKNELFFGTINNPEELKFIISRIC